MGSGLVITVLLARTAKVEVLRLYCSLQVCDFNSSGTLLAFVADEAETLSAAVYVAAKCFVNNLGVAGRGCRFAVCLACCFAFDTKVFRGDFVGLYDRVTPVLSH